MKVLVIGVGYWGSKLLDRLKRLQPAPDVTVVDLNLVAICQERPEVMERLRGTLAYDDYQLALTAEPDFDTCIVATPISTHYAIVKDCLLAGKHVLVEKPMAKFGAEARDLMVLAGNRGLVLRTDLTFLEHAAVKLLAGAELAALFWAGPKSPRSDEGILWTWGPHPVSIMLYAHLGKKPVAVEADVDDGYLDLRYYFEDSTRTVVNMRWGGPGAVALRQATLRDPDAHRYSMLDLTPIPDPEPLAQVVDHFLQAVKDHDTTPDWTGMKTVEVLEWTEQQLSKSRF